MQASAFLQIALIVGVCCVPGSCDLNTPAQSRMEKVASTYCECTTRLAELNKQADTTRQSDLNPLFQQMQAEYGKARECAATIVAQYGHLKAAELDSVNTILVTKCPDLAGHPDLLREMLGE